MWSTKSGFNTLASVEHSRFEPQPSQAGSQEQEIAPSRSIMQAEDQEELSLNITHTKTVEVKRHPGDEMSEKYAQRASRSQLFLALRNKHQHGEHYLFTTTNDSDEQTCSLSPHCRIS